MFFARSLHGSAFCSVVKVRADVGSVDRWMTARRPARALSDERGMIDFADDEPAGAAGGLRMAFETEIEVALGEELAVDRAVGVMTARAAFPQRAVLEDV